MEKQLHISIQIIRTEALAYADATLRDAAIRAAGRAYAPYSNFHVGAAVRLDDGEVIEGNNQENIAYPSGLCAERIALYAANAKHPEAAVETIAITAIKNGEIEDTISPCGACRQVLLEAETRYRKPVRMLLCGKTETVIIASAKDLLPLSFDSI